MSTMLRDVRFRAVLRGESFEMKKFDPQWATVIASTLLLLGWWYWCEYRPQKIKEECAQFTTVATAANREDGENQMSGDAFLKVADQFQKVCIDAGGVAKFKNALDVGQSYNKTNL